MALTFSATTLRNDGFIALSRLLQAILTIVVLALVGSGFPTWNTNGAGCSIPSSMNYMVACAVLTLFFLVYLAISTCSSHAKFLWNPYLQLGLDGLFVIFWIAACAVAKPTCSQFGTACSIWMSTAVDQWKAWHGLEMDCYGDNDCKCYTYTSSSPGAVSVANIKRTLSSSASSDIRAGGKLVDQVAEKQGVGAALVLLFAFTLGLGLYRFIQDKRTAQTTADNGQNEPLSSEGKNEGPQDTAQNVSP